MKPPQVPKETRVIHEEKTDQDVYEMLKENKGKDFMDADEWKEQRIEQLKKEGKLWSY